MKTATHYEAHELANLVPSMSDEDVALLETDIRNHGLHDPITLHEGLILDGRHRYGCCLMAGVEPRFVEYDGDDPIGFVISKNIHRRHLNQAQRREVIGRLLEAQPERSDRQIAKEAGTDHKTVAKVRTAKEGRGEIPRVEKRTDTKGRAQPGKRKTTTAAKSKPKSDTGQKVAKTNGSSPAVPVEDDPGLQVVADAEPNGGVMSRAELVVRAHTMARYDEAPATIARKLGTTKTDVTTALTVTPESIVGMAVREMLKVAPDETINPIIEAFHVLHQAAGNVNVEALRALFLSVDVEPGNLGWFEQVIAAVDAEADRRQVKAAAS